MKSEGSDQTEHRPICLFFYYMFNLNYTSLTFNDSNICEAREIFGTHHIRTKPNLSTLADVSGGAI